MRLRLRTVRKAFVLLGFIFSLTCVYLYIYAGYREAKSADSNRRLEPLKKKDLSSYVIPASFSSSTSGSVSSWLRKGRRNETNDQNARMVSMPTPKTIVMDRVFDELKFDNQPGGVWKQGFDITYDMAEWDSEPLEVFLVPHSHQDPGWIYTIDEYFNTKTRAGLDATLKVLLENPEARFIYAEMSFFSMWINTLSQKDKELVQKLLHRGQLEIASGGWVMTDEATATYYSMLDQMIEGHHWLWENFAYRPNVSWSIDPFGQSTTMAYLVRKMGFTAMVIGRVHYEVKKYLAQRRALEFHWRQSWDSDAQPQIPCHLLAFYAYDVPHTCGPDPSICCQFDFWRLRKSPCPWNKQPIPIHAGNVDERAALLADQYRKKATLYNRRGVLLVPLGDDFRYLSTNEWMLQLSNYKSLIKYFDAHSEMRIKLRFATLSEYFRSFYQRHGHDPRVASSGAYPAHLDLTQFTGDLFTYADRDHDYWSGYFTSRPIEKLITRVLESELRASELLYTFARHSMKSAIQLTTLDRTISVLDKHLTEARRNLGIFLHHDGITGTAKPHVVLDYNRRLLSALKNSRFISSISIAALLLIEFSPAVNLERNALNLQQISNTILQLESALNGSGIAAMQSIEDNFSPTDAPTAHEVILEDPTLPISLTLFNPLPQPRSTIAAFTVQGPYTSFDVTVTPSDNAAFRISPEPITIQVGPPSEMVESSTRVYVGPVNLAPLSISQLVLQPMKSLSQRSVVVVPEKPEPFKNSELLWITGQTIRLGFDARSGFLRLLCDTRQNLVLNITIDFLTYHTDNAKRSKSGAYLFIPDRPGKPMELPLTPKVRVIRGPLVQEVTVDTPLVIHTVRLQKYPSEPSEIVEVENTVDLNDVQPQNIELVMRIQSNISNTNGQFFTDSNCFQFVRRQYYKKIPFQGNLYPMSCGTFIQSTSSMGSSMLPRLHVFTTYSHGVTSPQPGALYIWLDRRSTSDDDRGLGHGLFGKWKARSNFRLFAENISPRSFVQTNITAVISPTARTILNDLIRPVQRFLADHHLTPYMAPSVRLMADYHFPADYELVSMKTLHHTTELFRPFSDVYGTQVGIVLHRLPISPKDLQQSSITVHELFFRLNRSKAIRTPLTMLPDVTAASLTQQLLTSITVNPMELEAFLLVV